MIEFPMTMLNLKPAKRRVLIMLMDVGIVLAAIPLSLLLSKSQLSFEPLSLWALGIWSLVVIASHLLFRSMGFYDTLWRFASTPDFFNIITGSAILSLGLYLVSKIVSWFEPLTGLNGRQFLAFFLILFAILALPRLLYRHSREGAGWQLRWRSVGVESKRALFVGSISEADVIIRLLQAGNPPNTQMLGIFASERTAIVGRKLRNVMIVATPPRLFNALEEYVTNSKKSIDLIIFGHEIQESHDEFTELVRVARQKNIEVVQFSGLSQLGERGDQAALETIDMETILRRATVSTDVALIRDFISDRRILITGGAGSIGRIIVRRCLQFGAEAVLVADNSEFGIFRLNEELRDAAAKRLSCRIIDVTDKKRFKKLIASFKPDIIFHAAALKHVPLLEEDWESAIKTNVFGTLACAEAAAECGVSQFVLISTDKASDPVSILGMTKRTAEQIVNTFHACTGANSTRFTTVRFGNVFGSDGSVANVFERQIRNGGPVTITDRSMTRYMMTTGEAVDLVIKAASYAQGHSAGCGLYMLDMGEPVSILTVAETMIRFAGLKPHIDIQIAVTGIRPGEKLHESLIGLGEEIIPIDIPSVFGVSSVLLSRDELRAALGDLLKALENGNREASLDTMAKLWMNSPGNSLVVNA